MTPIAVRVRSSGLLALLAAAVVAAMYLPTLGYGFYYDDYHFVRPYSAASVASTFSGPWDSAGIEIAYYRPLTICLYAVRFAALGFDAHANHALSLLMFAAAAAIFAIFVEHVSGSRVAAIAGVFVFGVHPGVPYSAVGWITNQMHLLELILVFAALAWWFHVRSRPAAWWIPLLLLQAAVFLVKEDGVMLVPAIVALHTARKYLVERGLPHVPWRFLAGAASVGVALLLLRSHALHGVPTHRMPAFEQAWTNWSHAFNGAFRFVPAKRRWQGVASWFATLVPIAALGCWRRLSPPLRFTLVAGVVIAVLFELPFAFVLKAEQMHLVDAGAAMTLTAGIAGLLHAARPWRAGLAAIVLVAATGVTAMAAVARDITTDFAPFGPVVAHTDRIVEGWAAVPEELRDYLADKRTADPAHRPDPDPSRALPMVAFELYGRERSPDGVPYQWMHGARADVYVRRGTHMVTFSVRHERGAFGEPAHVRVESDGRQAADMTLDDGAWHRVDVTLRQRAWIGLDDMHHIRLALDHAWTPSAIIPGSRDTRTLGLQIGVIAVR